MKIKGIYVLVVGGAMLCTALLAMSVNAQGPSGFVFIDENGNGQFDAGEWNGTSIQAAVDAANPGDTVYVWNGTYYENVEVNKTVSIIGNGSQNCIVQAADSNKPAFYINADWVNISGFSITGASNSCGIGTHPRAVHGNFSENNIMNCECGIQIPYPYFKICLLGTPGQADTVSLYNHLVGQGHQVALHSQTQSNVLSPSYYAGFDLVIFYGNGETNRADNIIASGTPFISTSYYNTDDIFLGSGTATMHQSRSTFNVTDNSHYITAPYSLGTLTFESSMWTDATDPTGCSSRVLVNSGSETQAILIVNETNKYAYFGWYRFFQMSATGWDIFNRTVEWAIGQADGCQFVIYNNNITGATYGINCSASGFHIAKNTFWHDDHGLYWNINKDLAENYVVYDSTAEGNEFYMNTNNDAIYAYVDLDYNQGAYNATIGNISFLNNTFYMNGTGADGIDMSGYAEGIYVKGMNGGNISVGTVNISNNRFYGGHDIIYFWGDFEEMRDVNLVVGDVIVTGNTILNHSQHSICVSPYGATGWHGNTKGIYGDLIICDNYIYNNLRHSPYTSRGIVIYNGGYTSFYDNASLTTGIVLIEGNEVTVEGDTVYFDYEYVPYYFKDKSSLRMGNVYIEDNMLNSTKNSCGIYIEYYEEEVGDGMYDNALVHLPNFTIAGNTIYSSKDGIQVYSYENPCYMLGDSSIYFGDFNIDDNTIYSGGDGVCFYYEEFCDYNYGNSTTEIGNISITNNDIHSTGSSGITVYYEIGYDINDNSKLIVGNVDIHGNEVDCKYGVNVWSYVYAYDSTTVEMGYVNITENEIRNCTDYGIYLYYDADASISSTISIERALIKDNTIDNCSTGIYVYADISNDTGATATLESAIIDGNTISNCIAATSGIHIDGMEGTNITDNLIFGCDTGIYIDEDSNHTTIMYNTITRNDVGIYVYGGYEYSYENVDTQIHYNDIYGNYDYGLIYDVIQGATPYINATYNWWGSINGPNSNGGNQQDPVTDRNATGNGDYIYGGDVTDNIHFDPWTGLTLYKGWNLITFSFINSIQSASDLMSSISGCTVVTMWDNINQKYVSYIDGFGEDFELNNGSSYFVFLTGGVMTYLIGDVYQPEINITFHPGYNLIGWPYPEYEPAEDIADNITHCMKVAKWNAQEQTWVAEYITALDSYNFDLLMGEGAFVFVSEQSQWQVAPSQPVPP